MLKRSGNLLYFSFWDPGYQKLLVPLLFHFAVVGVIFYVGWKAGLSLSDPYVLSMLMLMLLFAFVLIGRWIKVGRRVWLDLDGRILVIGTSRHGSKHDAAEFESVRSRVETTESFDGFPLFNYLLVELHGKKGDLEIARFSNAKFEVDHWSDHAQARVLRSLIAEHWGLRDDGVVGETFPQMLADVQASLEQSFNKQILPKAADRWIRRGLKLALLALASPLICGGLKALLYGRLSLEDLWLLMGTGALFLMFWLGLDMIGNRGGVRWKMVRASLWIAVACFAVALMLLTASSINVGSFVFFASLGISAFAYWYRATS